MATRNLCIRLTIRLIGQEIPRRYAARNDTSEQTMPKKTKIQAIEELTFEQAFAELEESVRTLEQGALPLEESLLLFERGQQLAVYCGKLLDTAELKIEQIGEA
jgi:exodeoxyribonuclease VII small subunit